ncbi:MAG TPA: hypothetical protein VGP26_29835 [Actinophytocola sp.]|jgi:hypothetical protein|nr:hypothetical protein [Actinophytocola sp.]
MTTDDKTVPHEGTTHRPFWLTDMPTWLMLLLVVVGLPRTILADLNVVPPESGILYYFLALAPYVAWVAVAIVRETRKPIADFIVLGVLYGLSLVLVHQVLWNAGAGEGQETPAAARSFAEGFSPGMQDLATRGYTVMIAMAIGIGSGIVVALIAFVAKLVRSRRLKA